MANFRRTQEIIFCFGFSETNFERLAKGLTFTAYYLNQSLIMNDVTILGETAPIKYQYFYSPRTRSRYLLLLVLQQNVHSSPLSKQQRIMGGLQESSLEYETKIIEGAQL